MTITDLNDDLIKLNRVKGKNGSQFFWRGYDIIKFSPNGRAPFSKDGVFHQGQWGFETKFEVSDEGKWRVY